MPLLARPATKMTMRVKSIKMNYCINEIVFNEIVFNVIVFDVIVFNGIVCNVVVLDCDH